MTDTDETKTDGGEEGIPEHVHKNFLEAVKSSSRIADAMTQHGGDGTRPCAIYLAIGCVSGALNILSLCVGAGKSEPRDGTITPEDCDFSDRINGDIVGRAKKPCGGVLRDALVGPGLESAQHGFLDDFPCAHLCMFGQCARGSQSEGSARADGYDAVVRFNHISVAAYQVGVFIVAHQ